MKMTQPQIEDKIEELERRIARLERSLCVPPAPFSPGGPGKFKHIDVIPVVDE